MIHTSSPMKYLIIDDCKSINNIDSLITIYSSTSLFICYNQIKFNISFNSFKKFNTNHSYAN